MDKLSSEVAMNRSALMVHFDSINTALRNQCLSKAGLVIGSGSAKAVKIANTVTYSVDGQIYTKTTAEITFTATTHDIAADASTVQEAVYLLCLDAAGTGSLVKGATASGSGKALIPSVPASKCAIGAVRIAVAAGATPFDASSDDLSAAHITDTYYDFGYLAPRFDSAL